MNLFQRILHKPFFIKLLHWEYWSMPVLYAVINPVFGWFCIRCGCRFFFTAANPNIGYGGFLMESKKEIYDQLPEGSYPQTIFVKAGESYNTIVENLKAQGISYPMIAKPDIGMRGLAAKKIESEEDLKSILPVYTIDFLIQEFIPYENEVGIFYYRYPGEASGKISGIVGKEFLSITGDGKKTLLQLLQNDKRFILQVDSLKKEYGDKLNEILAAGKKELLVPYGNHARGAKFLDYSDLADDELLLLINTLCLQVPEFYFGRLDFRYNDWNEVKEGKGFSIIELNGAGSEPTHMYDPKHSLFFAWKEIIRHWIILFRISKLNHKRGYRYMSFKDGMKMLSDNTAYLKKLEAVHEALLKNS